MAEQLGTYAESLVQIERAIKVMAEAPQNALSSDEYEKLADKCWELSEYLQSISESLRIAASPECTALLAKVCEVIGTCDDWKPLASGAATLTADELDQIGRLMHESWSKTKRAQGFHGANEECTGNHHRCLPCREDYRCRRFHADLVPWEQLPEKQKDINRHAFDALLPWIAERERGLREALAAKDHMLNNLLAVVHRVGGHYTAEHGLEKSVEDAMQISSDRNAEAELAAKDREIAELRKQCDSVEAALMDVHASLTNAQQEIAQLKGQQ